MENTARLKVRGIIFQDGRVLLGKDAGGGLIVPGGTMDIGESIENCFTREMIEETGIIPQKGELYGVYDHRSKSLGITSVSIVYHILNKEDFGKIDLSKASHGYENEYMKFMDLEEIDKKIIEYGYDIFPFGIYKDIRKTLLSMS